MNRELGRFYGGVLFVSLLATLGTGDVSFMLIAALAISILRAEFRSWPGPIFLKPIVVSRSTLFGMFSGSRIEARGWTKSLQGQS